MKKKLDLGILGIIVVGCMTLGVALGAGVQRAQDYGAGNDERRAVNQWWKSADRWSAGRTERIQKQIGGNEMKFAPKNLAGVKIVGVIPHVKDDYVAVVLETGEHLKVWHSGMMGTVEETEECINALEESELVGQLSACKGTLLAAYEREREAAPFEHELTADESSTE